MTFLVQLSDTHIVEPGKLLYGAMDTAAHLALSIEQINTMRPQPDLVLITGDLVERPGPDTYGHFSELVSELRAPVRLLPGNHDNPAIMDEFFTGTELFPAESPHYQYTIEHLPFRILALNSHFEGSELPFLGPHRLEWIEEQLAASDRPALLAIHHPPIQTGIEFIDMVGRQWCEGLRALIEASPQVKLVICGHGHTDIVGHIGTAPVYMAGSTAHQLIAARGQDMAPASDNRPAAPVMHQWLGDGFASGSHPWPSWADDKRISEVTGPAWEQLKDHMRGSMR